MLKKYIDVIFFLFCISLQSNSQDLSSVKFEPFDSQTKFQIGEISRFKLCGFPAGTTIDLIKSFSYQVVDDQGIINSIKVDRDHIYSENDSETDYSFFIDICSEQNDKRVIGKHYFEILDRGSLKKRLEIKIAGKEPQLNNTDLSAILGIRNDIELDINNFSSVVKIIESKENTNEKLILGTITHKITDKGIKLDGVKFRSNLNIDQPYILTLVFVYTKINGFNDIIENSESARYNANLVLLRLEADDLNIFPKKIDIDELYDKKNIPLKFLFKKNNTYQIDDLYIASDELGIRKRISVLNPSQEGESYTFNLHLSYSETLQAGLVSFYIYHLNLSTIVYRLRDKLNITGSPKIESISGGIQNTLYIDPNQSEVQKITIYGDMPTNPNYKLIFENIASNKVKLEVDSNQEPEYEGKTSYIVNFLDKKIEEKKSRIAWSYIGTSKRLVSYSKEEIKILDKNDSKFPQKIYEKNKPDLSLIKWKLNNFEQSIGDLDRGQSMEKFIKDSDHLTILANIGNIYPKNGKQLLSLNINIFNEFGELEFSNTFNQEIKIMNAEQVLLDFKEHNELKKYFKPWYRIDIKIKQTEILNYYIFQSDISDEGILLRFFIKGNFLKRIVLSTQIPPAMFALRLIGGKVVKLTQTGEDDQASSSEVDNNEIPILNIGFGIKLRFGSPGRYFGKTALALYFSGVDLYRSSSSESNAINSTNYTFIEKGDIVPMLLFEFNVFTIGRTLSSPFQLGVGIRFNKKTDDGYLRKASFFLLFGIGITIS